MDLTELRRTISLCKDGITTATQDLTKLTGRNYDRPFDDHRPFSNITTSSRDNLSNNQRFIIKRRNSYENENPIEIKKLRLDKEAPSMNSVVQMTKGRTRNDALHELKTKENPKEKERCKRLFGHLMGTLNSIKKESEKSSNDPQQMTRLKIEKKVEEDHKLISETIQREQEELLRTKRDRQNDLKILNQRYRAAEAFERWRVEKEKMKGHIRTSKAPFIFYKPKITNEETLLRISQTAREIDEMIDTRKKKLEIEIDRVVKRHLEATGKKQIEGMDLYDDNLGVSYRELAVSGPNKLSRKERSKSQDSFGSEDYDDMIEEIEITMHDEPAAIHDDEDRLMIKEEPLNDDDETYINEVERVIEEVERDINNETNDDVDEPEDSIKENAVNIEEMETDVTEGDDDKDDVKAVVETENQDSTNGENIANAGGDEEDMAESKEDIIEMKEDTVETKEDTVETKEDTVETKEDTVETKEVTINEQEQVPVVPESLQD